MRYFKSLFSSAIDSKTACLSLPPRAPKVSILLCGKTHIQLPVHSAKSSIWAQSILFKLASSSYSTIAVRLALGYRSNAIRTQSHTKIQNGPTHVHGQSRLHFLYPSYPRPMTLTVALTRPLNCPPRHIIQCNTWATSVAIHFILPNSFMLRTIDPNQELGA